jgi:hypothetical protein
MTPTSSPQWTPAEMRQGRAAGAALWFVNGLLLGLLIMWVCGCL